MEIKTDSYQVTYDHQANTVFFVGSLRLNGTSEYAAIYELLNNVVEANPGQITLDIRELKFLNSSGINMLSKFVIGVRKKQNVRMSIIGLQEIPWQGKSLKNLQRLMPSLSLELG